MALLKTKNLRPDFSQAYGGGTFSPFSIFQTRGIATVKQYPDLHPLRETGNAKTQGGEDILLMPFRKHRF